MGRADANKGFVFLNEGRGNFSYLPQSVSGLNLKDDTRQLLFIKLEGQSVLMVGQNDKSILSYILGTLNQ